MDLLPGWEGKVLGKVMSALSCASVSRMRLVMSVVRRRAFVNGRGVEKLVFWVSGDRKDIGDGLRQV